MKRRDFLKNVCGVITGAVVLPTIIKTPSVVKANPTEILNLREQAMVRAAQRAANPPIVVNPNEGLYNPTAIWARAMAKALAKNENEIISSCFT